MRIVILLLLLCIPSVMGFNVALSDQGTGVRDRGTGILLDNGNLPVLIFDNLTAGNLIYNETFLQSIDDGAWNVMLGETKNLSLNFGDIYYRDYRINGEDTNFTNNNNDIVGRQFFYSPLGFVNGSLLINASVEKEKLAVCANGEVLQTSSGAWTCAILGSGSLFTNNGTTVFLQNFSFNVSGDVRAETGFFDFLGSLFSFIGSIFTNNLVVNNDVNLTNISLKNSSGGYDLVMSKNASDDLIISY